VGSTIRRLRAGSSMEKKSAGGLKSVGGEDRKHAGGKKTREGSARGKNGLSAAQEPTGAVPKSRRKENQTDFEEEITEGEEIGKK